MVTALIFLTILIVLVMVHEFGHFIAAKKIGVYVEEFGFGFPPRVIGKKIGETLYSLNLLPIGGFVRLYGEEYDQDTHTTLEGKTIPSTRTFVHKKPWQKTIIVLAGVCMNFLLGWICFTYLFIVGTPTPNGIEIMKVQSNSPASYAGLKTHDKLLFIKSPNNSIPLTTVEDLVKSTQTYADTSISLVGIRGDAQFSVSITPRSRPPQGQGSLGVTINQLVKIRSYPWYKAPWYGLTEAAHMVVKICTELLRIPAQLILKHKTSVEFSGPIGIAKVVGQARQYGINALLEITALLSLNLAVINVLPFPALDGGRLMFILYEWIVRRKPNKKFEKYINSAGIIFLITMSVVVTLYDIIRLW